MKSYLIIQLARFGDLIQTKRLIVSLVALPESDVHLCVDNSLVSLAKLIYPQVIVHGVFAHNGGESPASIKDVLNYNYQAFRDIKSISYEKIFNLNYSGLNFRLAALFSPEQVEGYSWKDGQEICDIWPRMAMRWAKHRRIGLNLVDFWAYYCEKPISADSVNPVATPQGGGIGIVLAGRESRRSLPIEVLSQIVTTYTRVAKEKIFLLGGQGEYIAGQRLLKQLPLDIQADTRNLAGKTSWADLIEVVGGLDMLLSPDTGTMHLAAHLGVPVNAFFLSSAWCFETGPYGSGHTIFQAVTDCSPCLENQPCPRQVKCLECFSQPEFHRYLVTKQEKHCPSHLAVLSSAFDKLGQTYTLDAGADITTKRYSKLRLFLLDYLTHDANRLSDMEREFALEIYRETDWIAQTSLGESIGL